MINCRDPDKRASLFRRTRSAQDPGNMASNPIERLAGARARDLLNLGQ
jgi:hypothetical protein